MLLIDVVSRFVFENDVQCDAEFLVVDGAIEFPADFADGKVDRAGMSREVLLSGSEQRLDVLGGWIMEVEKYDVCKPAVGVSRHY